MKTCCLFFALVAAGCTSQTLATNCTPECAPGFTCVNGACVLGDAVDLAMKADGQAMGCNPACSGATPHCNASGHCVGCLVDGDCPMGQYCKIASDTVASCVVGCTTDDHCGGKKCCNKQCVDVSSDVSNCGDCGKPCSTAHAASSCANGSCTLGACTPGWGDCNADPKDGCETNLHLDTANCTMCGMSCNIANANPGCSDGCYIEACTFGYDDCNTDITDGCETSVLSDVNNCGSCGSLCKGLPNAKATCTAGNCVLGQCNVGFFDCNNNPMDGCEVATGTDVNNCGTCGNKCANGLVCINGGCTCAKCNFPNAASSCVNNVCVMGACVQGFADCNNSPNDGCEVNILTDKNNCNGCNAPCGNGLYCVNGQCQAGCLMGMGPPNACMMGTDPQFMTPYVICEADCQHAWISQANKMGGNFHALEICQSLGYTKVSAWDGDCGDVCGYCAQNSCMNLGPKMFGRDANQPNCGMDQFGGIFCMTVQWLCAP
jgi:hypothetical protein